MPGKIRSHSRIWTSIAIVALATLTACSSAGSGNPSAAAGSGAQSSNVSFRTAYLFNGYDAPYALAGKNGYFADNRLNVSIGQGSGSATTLATVAAGTVDFGAVDAPTALEGIANSNLPVKILAVWVQGTVSGFTYKSGTTLSSAQDLVGKTIIVNSAEGSLGYLEAIAKQGNVDYSKLTIRNGPSSSRLDAFYTGGSNAVLFDSFINGEYQNILAQESTAKWVSFSHFGIDPMSIALVTSDAMIKNHPDEVREFVKAAAQGFEYSAAHPEDAAKAATKLFPSLSYSAELKEWQVTIPYLHTAATNGSPLGYVPSKQMQDMITQLHDIGFLKSDVQVSDAYTGNQFIS